MCIVEYGFIVDATISTQVILGIPASVLKIHVIICWALTNDDLLENNKESIALIDVLIWVRVGSFVNSAKRMEERNVRPKKFDFLKLSIYVSKTFAAVSGDPLQCRGDPPRRALRFGGWSVPRCSSAA